MTAPWWFCFILLMEFIHCYENLSRRLTTTLLQSSTYNDRYASYANDGDLQTRWGFCAHTSPGRPLAWFQVDLGKEYSIKSVKIYYRTEGDGPNNWKQFRFKHFYLDVSNSPAAVTNTTQRTRCYTDTSPGLPDNIIELPCKQTARYVIVETTYDAPEDIPTTGAILEICEIQVNGCEIGKYGDGCRDCSGCQTCDIISGICTSVPCGANCVSGLCNPTIGYCTQGCINGYWGNTCTSTCPQNCQGGSCDRISGYCNGCSNNNYWGQSCNTPCSQYCNGGVCYQNNGYCSNGCTLGRYGNKCEHHCNEKCSGNTCDQNNGVCTNGCADFYYGYTCEYECSPYCSPRRCDRYNGTCTGCSSGYFGSSCRDNCSVNCAEGTCDQQTGKCHGGCKPNWTGDKCDRCDSTHYGINCSQMCNVNCKDRVCNSGNGFCTFGCKSGFYGDTCKNTCPSCPSGCDRYSGDCERTCPNDKYGKQCDLPCSPGCTGGCNKDTGVCDRGCVVGKFGANCSENCNTGCIADCDQNEGSCKCKTGWQGNRCDECSSDHYGQLCDHRCSTYCENEIYFSNNGTCVGGCIGTFSNDKCNQENVQSCTTECDSTMVIVSIVVSVVIVLTGSVVNVMLWRRNQSQNVKRRFKENSNSQTTAHEFSDIPNSENRVISPYAELGDLDKPNTYETLHQYTNAV